MPLGMPVEQEHPSTLSRRSGSLNRSVETVVAEANAGLPGLSRLTRGSKAALEALDHVEAAYGGRQELAGQLAEQTDAKAQQLVKLLADPKRSSDSLLALCLDAGLAPSTLLSLLRDSAFVRAVATAQIKLATRLPAVVDRVADSAEGHFAPCPCTNGGSRPAQPACKTCNGSGHQWTKPSLAHQTLLLEATELLKRGGPTVQVQQNVGIKTGTGESIDGASGRSYFDQMVKGLAVATRLAPTVRPADRPMSVALTDDPLVESTVVDADLLEPPGS